MGKVVWGWELSRGTGVEAVKGTGQAARKQQAMGRGAGVGSRVVRGYGAGSRAQAGSGAVQGGGRQQA